MPTRLDDSTASSARTWLLAACAFGFALVLWNTFVSPRYFGGFGIEGVWPDARHTIVTYLKPGWPAENAGLRVGDKIEYLQGKTFSSQWVAVRFLGISGRPYPMRVERGRRVFYLSLVPTPHPVTFSDWLDDLTNWWFTLFAAVVAWFGVGPRSRLLSWLMILQAMGGNGLGSFLSPWPWLNETAFLLNAPVTTLGIALLATISSTFGQPIAPLRRTLKWSAYAAAVIGVGMMSLLSELMITPWFDRFWPFEEFNRTFGGWLEYCVSAWCCVRFRRRCNRAG